MTFLKVSLITLLTLILIGSAGYLLASTGIRSQPGYAELTLPSWLSTNTVVALTLGPIAIKPVRWTINRVVDVSDQKLELSERILLNVLQDLQAVQLRIYEVEGNRQVFESAIAASVISLKQDDWQVILSVREHDEHVVVMQSVDHDLISGLSVLISTPDKAVFINLVGQFKPESMTIIADSFDSSIEAKL